ncbi:hypothetical protein A4A49_40757 [Nicotiana attenuata]|uniref:Uncharacterized protein n=1 Tax=Nicotiana attenuata TaxID=49451 RepID=A0A314KGM9_NICAT|nr:hypothetical protein A4A49_40757 [Nicotiana attenuata]
MAEAKVVCACVLFLTLIIISYETLLSEGRVLKTEKKKSFTISNGENSQRKVKNLNFVHDHNNMHVNNVSEEDHKPSPIAVIDDMLTEGGPGHSPGVGHADGPT